jgi:hypothetical protein
MYEISGRLIFVEQSVQIYLLKKKKKFTARHAGTHISDRTETSN